MIEVHNKITVSSPEHAQHLEAAFSGTNHRMADIPGFVAFNLLKAQDGSHYIVRVVWESEDAFAAWTASEHFRQAHRGQSGEAVASTYQVVL